MPYICVNLTKKLTDSQKDAIKAGLGEKIALIPGKSERALMVDIADGRTMYYQGEKRDLAYSATWHILTCGATRAQRLRTRSASPRQHSRSSSRWPV